jgi:hypothetical protein
LSGRTGQERIEHQAVTGFDPDRLHRDQLVLVEVRERRGQELHLHACRIEQIELAGVPIAGHEDDRLVAVTGRRCDEDIVVRKRVEQTGEHSSVLGQRLDLVVEQVVVGGPEAGPCAQDFSGRRSQETAGIDVLVAIQEVRLAGRHVESEHPADIAAGHVVVRREIDLLVVCREAEEIHRRARTLAVEYDLLPLLVDLCVEPEFDVIERIPGLDRNRAAQIAVVIGHQSGHVGIDGLVAEEIEIAVVHVQQVALGLAAVGVVVASNQDVAIVIGQGMQDLETGHVLAEDLLTPCAVDVGGKEHARSSEIVEVARNFPDRHHHPGVAAPPEVQYVHVVAELEAADDPLVRQLHHRQLHLATFLVGQRDVLAVRGDFHGLDQRLVEQLAGRQRLVGRGSRCAGTKGQTQQ